MGHCKETPRQQMIGLMYLFLTCMLALNVSKDVLDSFVLVSESLGKTVKNYETKNQKVYDEFEKQLTLGRLGAVITNPRRPDYGDGLLYDENAAPSVYIESDIKRAKRLHLSRDK